MQTKDFRTKQLEIERSNISLPTTWPIAIDIGYSGTKLMSPNIVACFPSFATKLTSGRMEVGYVEGNMDILYEDEKGTMWIVGSSAQNNVSTKAAEVQSLTVYGRDRYDDPLFHVLADVAVGLGYRANSCGDPAERKLLIQTGLPNTYIREDSDYIKEAFSGHHEFRLKVGNDPWIDFSYDLAMDDVHVMPQPMGTLLSACSKSTGEMTEEGQDMFRKKTLLIDAGFGTIDTFAVTNQSMNQLETFDDCAMKEVLRRTSDEIFKTYKVLIPVPAMQKTLEDGYITVADRRAFKSEPVDYSEILFRKNEEVANECLQTLATKYGYFQEYKYIIVTGGCPWYDLFAEKLKGVAGLTVMKGTGNDNLPSIFSNVRGYYLYICKKEK